MNKSLTSGTDIYNYTGVITTNNTVLQVRRSGHSIVNSDDDGGYLNGPDDQINIDPMLGALQDNDARAAAIARRLR